VEECAHEGLKVNAELLKCGTCNDTMSGGFDPKLGIVLCENRFISKQHMEDTLAHELVHAYDNKKFNVDWRNCLHHACTEIRASSLSGDCKFTREFLRGHFRFAKHHQTCVKRRAVLSLRQNPACSAPGVAERAVAEVFRSCFQDTRPFDEIY